MNVLLAVLAALPVAEGEGQPADGTRTVIGALVTLGVIAIVISIGLAMGRGQRA
jgi:hypothetical protein